MDTSPFASQREVSEDSVNCRLFLRTESGRCENDIVLDCMLTELREFSESFCCDYLWQRDCFQIFLRQKSEILPPHFVGSTCFGDSTEDEWFVTALVFAITRKFPLTATLDDSDGQFLLIEAAAHLPDWVNPDSVENRVFIDEGELHLVPLSQTGRNTQSSPKEITDVTKGLSLVWGKSVETIAAQPIRDCVRAKISHYPESTRPTAGPGLNRHNVNVSMPLAAAHVFRLCPSLVAPAVEAFYFRDVSSMRSVRSMRRFTPTRANTVSSRVRFTRCLYAQLHAQKFSATKPFREAGYSVRSSDPMHHACDIGMKLTCGLEMLYQAGQRNMKPESNETSTSSAESLSTSEKRRWSRFKQSLERNGFFDGIFVGSDLYLKREQQAMEAFRNHLIATESQSSNTRARAGSNCSESRDVSASLYHSKTIDRLLESDCNFESFQQYDQLLPDDDSSWIEISPDDLDKFMTENYGNGPEHTKPDDGDAIDLESVINKMNQFVEKVSDIDGVQAPNGHNKEESGNTAPVDNFGMNLDVEKFMEILKNADPSSIFENADGLGLNLDDLSFAEEKCGEMSESSSDGDEVLTHENVSSRNVEDLKSTKSSETTIRDYMDVMDDQIARTKLGTDFERFDPPEKSQEQKHETDELKNSEAIQPVNLDMNLVKNLLESYSSQHGVPGPTSTILNSMGLRLPENADSTDTV
eukprot:985953_1